MLVAGLPPGAMSLDVSDDESGDLGCIFDGLEIDIHDAPSVMISAEEVQSYFISDSQSTELYELLDCVHQIFQHYGITYWLTGGSMIGLKRHGGIIPWDDDIDVCCFWSDRDKILSTEVAETFQANGTFIEEDSSFDIDSPTLLKVFRNFAPSKAKKCGKVPYPFLDIFFVLPPDNLDMVLFMSGEYNHRIYAKCMLVAGLPLGAMSLDVSDDESGDLGCIFDGLEIDVHDAPSVMISAEEVQSYFISDSQSTELYELLDCVHQIFQHFGITYWLTGGSMIGLKRHGGIIPWDDDIDVCCFWSDRDKILSTEVAETFQANGTFIEEDSSFDIDSQTLLKVFRNFAPSKAKKCGKVPYPFLDIFFVLPPDNLDMVLFMSGEYNHRIYVDELYPLQEVKFGPVKAMVPHNGLPQLERGYGKDWTQFGQIQQYDHISKQGRGGPRRKFEVGPWEGVSAKCSWKNRKVILPTTGKGG
eukprot:sb/3464359/